MILIATSDRAFMAEASGFFLAAGISPTWVDAERHGIWYLEVPEYDWAQSIQILNEMYAEELQRLADRGPALVWVPLLLRPSFVVGLGLALVAISFYYYSGGALERNFLFEVGSFDRTKVILGQWWRFVTAACLHGDWGHVFGNAAFLLVFGWAVAERVGVGFTLLIWLGSAVLGFIASLFFSKAELTVGSSGGLFGLVGLAGVHGYRQNMSVGLPLRSLRYIGAAAGLLAFTAFSPQANIPAHLGGFAGGCLLGLILPRSKLGWGIQVFAAFATMGIVWLAWWWGMVHLGEL